MYRYRHRLRRNVALTGKILFCKCKEPPDFPRNLHVIEKGSRYINISWTTSQDGNSPITQYIIEYKTDTGN